MSPTARAAWPVAEAVGRAGDIYLCHPLLLHARSKHLGARGDAALVRFMAHPAVRLHAPLRVAGGSRAGDTEALTPVERAMSALPFAAVPITLYPLIFAICAAHWHVPPPAPCTSIHSPGAMRSACAECVR